VHDRIRTFCEKHSLIPKGSTIVLGLSGGPDSVFLLHFLAVAHHAGIITLVTAHLDHGWRAESAADADWCVQEAQKLGIVCHVGQLSDFSPHIPGNGSQEELGRRARRLFLEQIAGYYTQSHIALGHHAQDQQETFFIRLLRGATISGLTGMKPLAGQYVRPLLETNKAEIVTYLDTHGICYLTDSSNSSYDYLRNRIRHTVLPALHMADTRFDQNFKKTVSRLQATQDYLQEQAKLALKTMSMHHNDVYKINTTQLLTLHPVMQQQIIITWLIAHQLPFSPSEPFLQEILRFARHGHNSRHAIHQGWSLIKKKEWLWVEK
jgi:tRNA(Ile)-lysidine synthase